MEEEKITSFLKMLGRDIRDAIDALGEETPWAYCIDEEEEDEWLDEEFEKRGMLAQTNIAVLFYNYIRMCNTLKSRGIGGMYLSYRDCEFEDMPSDPSRISCILGRTGGDEQTSKSIVGLIFTPKDIDEINKLPGLPPFGEESNLDRPTASQLIRTLYQKAACMNVYILGKLSKYSDADVLAVYEACYERYRDPEQGHYEADKTDYENWLRTIPQRDRKEKGRERRDFYLKQLDKSRFLDTIKKEVCVFSSHELDEARAAIDYLSDSNGLPDPDVVGRHLLTSRLTLSDDDIRAYFRYIHMAAYIDQRPLPGYASTIRAENLNVNTVHQMNVANNINQPIPF